MKLWHRDRKKGAQQRPKLVRALHGSALSSREVEVLELVAMGLTNAEIGKRLFLGTETVKTHVRHILEKFGARNRAHAVWLGVVDGWLTTTSPRATSDPSQPSRET